MHERGSFHQRSADHNSSILVDKNMFIRKNYEVEVAMSAIAFSFIALGVFAILKSDKTKDGN